MSRPDRTHLHQVFPLEAYGDTLVVTPAGDAAGFHLPHVHAEMAAVGEYLEKQDLKHLVIDLSRSRYFGSLILGQLIALSQRVRERGGRVALADPSNEMREVLKIMKVDQLWEIYGSRSQALSAIAKRPLKGYVALISRRAFPVALVGGAVAAWWYWPRRNLDHWYHGQLMEMYRTSRKLLGSSPSEAVWDRHLTKSREQLAQWTEELQVVASSQREPLRHLIYCTRDYLFPALQDKLKLDSYPHFMFFQEMTNAEKNMIVPVIDQAGSIRPAGLTNPKATSSN